MKKHVFYTEVAYGFGLILLALGTALTEFGGFGISMVVAPAYILYLKLSEFLPFFTFGMAEYILQFLVLALMMLLLRRSRAVWWLSFAAAVIYGLFLDGSMMLTAMLPADEPVLKGILYILGVLLCAEGIALLFHAYLPPEAYELFVKEISQRFGKKLHSVKTIYDCCSCGLAVLMSWLLLGGFQGIGIGTVLCALLNGTLIRLLSMLLERYFVFSDRFPIRKYFTESEEIL